MRNTNLLQDLVIIGAGDFGREVAALIERINENNEIWNLCGFVDDDLDLIGQSIDGYPVLGDLSWLISQKEELYVVCSVGDSVVRKSLVEKCKNNDKLKYAILVDPSAILMKNTTIGEGSIIAAGTVIIANVKLGEHSIINLNCTIGHDTIMGKYFTAHPGTNISGGVIIGDECYFGTGSTVIQGLKVGEKCTIGAGAVVVKNIDEQGTYVGIPAYRLK